MTQENVKTVVDELREISEAAITTAIAKLSPGAERLAETIVRAAKSRALVGQRYVMFLPNDSQLKDGLNLDASSSKDDRYLAGCAISKALSNLGFFSATFNDDNSISLSW